MRIVCPSCEAEYEVANALLRPGRATRCARCEHRWVPLPAAVTEVVAPPEPEVIAEPQLPPPPVGLTAMDRLSAVPVKPQNGGALRLAWAGSVAALLLLLVVFFVEHTAIAVFWPPSQRFYAAFGVAPAPAAIHEGTDHGGQHPADRDR